MKSVASTIGHAGRVGFAMILSFMVASDAHPGLRTDVRDVQATPRVEANGTIHVPAFTLPLSSYLSEDTRDALKQMREVYGPEWQKKLQVCPSVDGADQAKMAAIRQCQAEAFYTTAHYKSVRDRYDVTITSQEIAGVYVEVFTPKAGIAAKNAQRLLLNVHAGGFREASRWASHLESIPIASVGQIKVISIDYRMGPEYTFPAASEDVAAVYRELLKSYQPQNIGLYGCSAGGQLTAQSIAWFQKESLPLPGAIGMFCAAAPRALDDETPLLVRSDAAYIAGALSGTNFEDAIKYLMAPYFKGIDRTAPLVSPGDDDQIMAKFPPSLLISGTRDFALSEVLVTHAQLVRLGVEAELHVWEGMGHFFFSDPGLPESREAYNVIVNFFITHLGV